MHKIVTSDTRPNIAKHVEKPKIFQVQRYLLLINHIINVSVVAVFMNDHIETHIEFHHIMKNSKG